jgi:hypothetical protein
MFHNPLKTMMPSAVLYAKEGVLGSREGERCVT